MSIKCTKLLHSSEGTVNYLLTSDILTGFCPVTVEAVSEKHLYIAFRLSDNQGLLPANNMQGRPIVLELAADGEPIAPTAVSEAALATKGRVAYRKPVTVMAKLMDGQKVLMQTRVPVYQLGKIMSFPMDVTLK